MNNKKENYLDKIPVKPDGLSWCADEKGIVTLNIENKGVFNKIAQKLFKKPKISYIHLDENGSFVWQAINGVKTVGEIGDMAEEHFGEAIKPTYERIATYFGILSSYGFVKFK